MANKIGYKIVANHTATADKAPYVGMVIPVGSLAYDNILAAMIKSGTFLTKATAKYMLDAFYEYCAEVIAEKVVRVSTGTVAVFPAIDGSFDTEDSEFDPTRNRLLVGAALSQELRDKVAGVVPEYAGEDTATAGVRISSVMDIASQTMKTVDGTGDFRIAGINLTVPDGEGESLELWSADGLSKVSDIVVSENDGGQRLTCHLKGDAGVAKGAYRIRLVSRGLDPTAPLSTLLYGVTVVTAVAEPPRFTSVSSGGEPNVLTFSTGGPTALTIAGTNLGGVGEDEVKLILSDGLELGSLFVSAEETEVRIDAYPIASGEHPASGSGDAKLVRGGETVTSVHFSYTVGS